MTKIAFWDLEEAMSSGDSPLDWYLDRETGEVILVGPDDGPEEMAERIYAAPERYLGIPSFQAPDEFQIMAAFAESVADEDIQALLAVALGGRKGVFARFRETLARFPDVREHWYEFQRHRRAEQMREWLAREGVEAELEVPAPKLSVVEREPDQPERPELVDLLLLGAPGGKTELLDGCVERVLECPDEGQARSTFRRLARELCEWNGVAWRRRFVQGTSTYEIGRFRLELRGTTLVLSVGIPPEVWRAFSEGWAEKL
jgi:hypothetical protein